MPGTQKQDETPKVETNPESESPEVQAAASAKVSEGEVHGLRQEAGLNQLPGHEANVFSWEQSEQGKKFVKDAAKKVKEDEEAAKATAKSLDKDGLSEAEKKYRETVSK